MLHIPPHRAFEWIRVAAAMALIVAAVASLSSPSEAAVFGRDTRQLLTAKDKSLQSKIGTLVSSQTGAFCTAFCVAPDLIATASHCLFGTEATPAPNLNALSFSLAAQPSVTTSLARSSARASNPNIISGTTRLAVAPPIGAASDWAIARLANPLCSAGGLRTSEKSLVEVDEAAAAKQIYQIAVHADLPDPNLRRAGPCIVRKSFARSTAATIAHDFASPQAVMFHDCDTGGGSSGSPLLIDTPDGPEVVGINVGTYVLSRTVTTSQDANSTPISEPISNTAVAIAAIRNALNAMRAAR